MPFARLGPGRVTFGRGTKMGEQFQPVSEEALAVRNAIANARLYLVGWLDHASRDPNPADAWALSKVESVSAALGACRVTGTIIPDENLFDPTVRALSETLAQARDVVRMVSAGSAGRAGHAERVLAMQVEDDLRAALAALRYGAANCGPFLPIAIVRGAEAHLPVFASKGRPQSAKIASMLVGSVARFQALLEAGVALPERHEWHVPFLGRIYSGDPMLDAQKGIVLSIRARWNTDGMDALNMALASDPRQMRVEIRLCMPATAEPDAAIYQARARVESGPLWIEKAKVHLVDTVVSGSSLEELAREVLTYLRPAMQDAVRAMDGDRVVNTDDAELDLSSKVA